MGTHLAQGSSEPLKSILIVACTTAPGLAAVFGRIGVRPRFAHKQTTVLAGVSVLGGSGPARQTQAPVRTARCS